VSVHLCRHIHAQPFVKSQRNDRQSDYDRTKAPQDEAVKMIWYMNAEELMIIANKRLCKQASEETRQIVKMMCDEVLSVCPEFDGLLVPMCQHHGGKCHEMFSCKNKNPS
jgi:thymidylate synthase ThyX